MKTPFSPLGATHAEFSSARLHPLFALWGRRTKVIDFNHPVVGSSPTNSNMTFIGHKSSKSGTVAQWIERLKHPSSLFASRGRRTRVIAF